ncbi:MAG: MBL fold metallo-hydrolase [Ignavibacteriales bacterium]|nr:MBL fold metallo-hydrolase [Ignavibacteriales bacterium]
MKNQLSTCVLGSSSAGNATLVWNARTAVLIDCGFGPVTIAKRLQELGLRFQDLDGVFLTHIHGDHVNEPTIRKLVKECIPIYCPPEIEHHLRKKYKTLTSASREKLFAPIEKSDIELDTLCIRAFEVPHNSPGGCFGYSVSSHDGGRTKKVSVSTDMACATNSALDQIANSDIIVIESNYDVEMLEQSHRPAWLKHRIRDDGHLSNDQCAESLLQIIDRSQTLPKCLALAHVSQQCNTNALAHECTGLALDGQGILEITLHETHPDRPSSVMTA